MVSEVLQVRHKPAAIDASNIKTVVLPFGKQIISVRFRGPKQSDDDRDAGKKQEKRKQRKQDFGEILNRHGNWTT
jgi:hypothetical protein